MGRFEAYAEDAVKLIMSYVPKLLLAIVVLIIGLWLIKIVVGALKRVMERSGTDSSLQKFITSLVSVLLKALLLISVASMIGIATTSFVAILGAAGLAVGLALQGSLANFAGGCSSCCLSHSSGRFHQCPGPCWHRSQDSNFQHHFKDTRI
jgi:Small-conductance mechanosensitive channel